MDDETETELYYAIEKNEPEKIKKLLENGLNPNVVFNGYDFIGKSWFWSPLHLCSEKGRLECAKVLLKHGADTEIGDRWCMTPLMYAVRSEWHNMVQVLLQQEGCNIDSQDSRGRSSVHIAIECSDDVCLRMLCEAGADVNHQDLVGRTPVWQAVTADGRKDHLKILLEHGCLVNIQDKRDKRIPLQEAIAYSEEDCLPYVEMLLQAGSDVNHRDEGNLNSILNLLSKLGRKAKMADENDIHICELLIKAGYRLNDKGYRSSSHKYGGGVLHKAAEQGDVRLVHMFLKHGADPDLTDDSGSTPLLTAIANDYTDCCLELLRHNCHPDVPGEIKTSLLKNIPNPLNNPLTPLYCTSTPMKCAISRGNIEAVYWLANHGCPYQSAQVLNLLDEEASSTHASDVMLADLVYKAFNLSTLFDLCVFKVRRLLSQNIHDTSNLNFLPNILKRRILLDHLYINLP